MPTKKRKQMDDSSEDSEEPPAKKRKINKNKLDSSDDSAKKRKMDDSSDDSEGIDSECNLTHHYISPSISLKTTDECIKSHLLTNYNYNLNIQEIKPKLSLIKKHDNIQSNEQILVKVTNLLSNTECLEIIKNFESKSFQDMNATNKYAENMRKSHRLLVLDEQMSELLWKRLNTNNMLQNDIMNKYNISAVPLGFGVSNTWNLSSVNFGMRINRYNSNNNDFFAYHKDAQYCPSADQRSIFTLIIYLNSDFYGGETKFYFNKPLQENTNILSDLTTIEEIHHFGGTKNGFECTSVAPSIGDAVIFSHDIIHEGCKLETPNKYKYILKTDIVVTRDKFQGFAISSEESKDYQRCLNYFTDAQRNELKGNVETANELYERSLCIRYSYPRKLNEIKTSSTHNLFIKVQQIWLVIFDYCSIREMECISYAFPSLHNCLITWKLIYNNKYKVSELDINNAFFIPKLEQRYGKYFKFEWENYNFFQQHIENCCCVAAMYAFYLMSHQEDAHYFIAEYDAHSQNVVAVPLHELLRDVFYERQCHGSYFKVQKDAQHSEDIIKDFENKMDRNYMSTVHGSQFIGGFAPTTKFKREVCVSAGYGDVPHACSVCGGRSEEAAYRNIKPAKHKLDYFNTLITMRDIHVGPTIGHAKMNIMEKYESNAEYIEKAEIKDFDRNLGCNQLIFDFSKNKLNVSKDRMDMTDCNCESCWSLKSIIRNYTSSNMNMSNKTGLKLNSLQFYTVNIESLFVKENKYSMSFNHAGGHCNCGDEELQIDVDVCGYLGYDHLNHIHIATMETNNNKLMMWLSYNYIAAL